MNEQTIDRFTGDYAFLSNFYRVKFRYKNRTYRTSEHAFQAAKCRHPADALAIKQAVTPGIAKNLGRRAQLRDDWDYVKVNVMREILRAKFRVPELRELLLATGGRTLIEGNYWGDRFWGVCEGSGSNWLGRLLMEVRSELQQEGAERRTGGTHRPR